ncbi:oligosaccharide flippase family protein [Actinoplanes sp. NBC_00393]|uniref:oligosaccharide flippase family protein n=1 Tax=Actinoplanes sp. NBC_00393 TaxID=2975953 RepID=UPI002E1B6CF0
MSATTESTEKIAGSAGLLVIRKVVASALSALSAIAVVRSLGPDHFGQYAAGMATYYLLTALTEFGFGQVLGMAIGRGATNEARFGRLVLRVSIAWSTAVAVAGVVVAAFFAFGTIRGGTLLVMTPAVALAGTSVVRQFFYARHEIGRMAAVDLSTSLVTAVALIGLALTGAPAVLIAAAASAMSVVNSALVLRAAWPWLRTGPGDQVRSGTTAPRLFRDAVPIGIASFLATAYGSIDLVLLSSLFSSEVVGQYAGAVKVLNILAIFPGLVMSIALPQIAADWNDPDRLGHLLARLWHWFVALVMPAIVVVAVHATDTMTVLFGDAYSSAGDLLRVLTIAAAAAMFSNLLGVVVMAADRVRWLVTQNIIALVLNVAGNLWLAPRFGIVTAAWLTVATEVFVCWGSWLLLRNRIPVGHLLRVSLLPLVAITIAVVAGALFTSSFWLALAVSVLCYLAAMTLMRAWPAEFVRLIPGMARVR